jgi:N-hydroxyarylamine O-acetyltransferase
VAPMKTTTRAAPTGEWETDRLDLDAYLERIAYRGALAADADTLRGLHRAHAATIPFENLDIILGRGIELDLDSVQRKLVRRLRGGYCFEHNLLLGAVLERLGYAVTRLAARVQPARPGPRTHMLLRVVAHGTPWLADVGFGASLLEPLPLQAATARQGGWTYRLGPAPADADAWLLQTHRLDGWSDLYAFTLEPQRPIDYAVYNHYTATHPRSPFVGQIVVLRTEPQVQHALRGRELTTTRPDGAGETRQVTADELPDVLAGSFGISLDADEAAGLRRAVA